MCRSMVDIHSETAQIRPGKKKKIEEETTGQKYNGLPYYIGNPEDSALVHCACNSPTAAALSISFLLNHATSSPYLNASITGLLGVIQHRQYEP